MLADLRHALRSLARARSLAAVAVLTLALGLGATTAVYSVVSAVLLRPLPYRGGDRIVTLGEAALGPGGVPAGGAPVMSTSYPNFADWQRAAKSFEAAAVFNGWRPALTGVGAPEVVEGALVTAGVFDVLRVAPALGRPMRPADNVAGGEAVVVLSDGFWRRRFGGDPRVVGRRLVLNGVPRTVIGVLPRGFRGPDALAGDVWGNNTFDATDARSARYLRAVARLAPGVTLAAARSELRAISARLAAAYPADNAGLAAVATPLREALVGDVRRPLLTLLGASALVLLIACANVANLLVARGLVRQREFALRNALGAGRARVVRHVLAEGVVLAAGGALAGAALAALATRAMVRLAPDAVREQPVGLDASVLAFALLATALTGALAGLVPAARAAGADPHAALKEGGRGTAGGAGLRARDALAAVQLALAVALLAGVGLLGKSFARLLAVDPGIRPAGVLAASVNLPAAKYPAGTEPAFFDAVLGRVRALPGVWSAAVASTVPFDGNTDFVAVDVWGRPVLAGADKLAAERFVVSPAYFPTLGVPLRAGRLLADADRAGRPRVAVVDEVFARRLAPGAPPASALGLRLSYGDTAWVTVVGVVGNVRHAGLDAGSAGQLYLPQAQTPWRWMSLVARAERPDGATALAPAVRAAVGAVDADQPVFGVTTVEALMRERTAGRRFVLLLVGAFAGVAIALGAVGLYGVTAYAVAQRARELGVRAALGARPADSVRLVLGGAARVGAAGLAVGLLVAFVATRLARAQLYAVGPGDPGVYAAVVALLAAVTLVASAVSARRAARVDPAAALRSE